jgi:cytochrome c oxidase subunit 2
VSATPVPENTWQGSFWLPENVSPMTGGQDELFYFIYGLSIFFFIIVVGFMDYFAWKYRKKKEGEKTIDIHGNTKLEIIFYP